MSEYYIPGGAGESELTEKRSRFLGHVRMVETEDEARAFIADMKKKYYILLMPLIVLTALLTAACSNDSIPDETIPEGMGRIRITISTPEESPSLTRAVNATPWEPTDHPWENLQTFRIIICNTSGTIVDIIDGTKTNKTMLCNCICHT